jgi:hypothetical protein
MEEISEMLRKEKVEIEGLYDELNNCKEMIVPLDVDYVQIKK